MHYSVLNFNLFLPIGSYFSRIFANSFDKRQVAACRSLKEFCANPKNASLNRKRSISLFSLQKSFVNSKAFVLSV
jgi:hypothetical protein